MNQSQRLFALLGQLPDELLEQALEVTPRPRRRWPIALAACLLLAVGLGLWQLAGPRDGGQAALSGPSGGGQPASPVPTGGEEDMTYSPAGGRQELSTPAQRAINWQNPEELDPTGVFFMESALHAAYLPLGDRVAEYHKLHLFEVPDGQLPQTVGEPYEGLEGWYRPGEGAGLQYLLHEEEGGFTLWRFSSFRVWTEEELAVVAEGIASNARPDHWTGADWFSLDLDFSPYSYGHVLETIYGIAGPEDIAEIAVDPPDMDNTLPGKALQAEIGSFTIDNPEEIALFYDAVSSMLCHGGVHWELIDLGPTDIPEDPSVGGNLLTRTRLARYLTVTTAGGAVIDSLKYTAFGGQFYEYGGIAYAPLEADQANDIARVFGIEVS